MASTQNAADSTPSTPGGAGLPQFLESIKTTAVGEAYAELQRSHLAHYEAAGEELTRERLADLFDLVVRAIRDRDLTPVGAFSEQVAHDRFEAGFDIAEVQAAFNTLEETLWRRIVAVEPRADLAEAVGLLSTVLGFGKDALARTYVSLACQRHVPSLDLSAMFAGTNS
jgi:hypothetical protein